MVESIARAAGAPFVETFKNKRDLEGFYRFINNKHIDFFELLDGHREATATRARSLDEVVVIHDTSKFTFPNRSEHVRKHLAKYSDQRQGFSAHASLVATADGERCPLGLIGLRPFVAEDKLVDDEARDYWREHFGSLESEHDRWLEAVEEAESDLDGVGKIIHLMDREGDSYEIIATMRSRGQSFVVRLAQERNVHAPESDEVHKLSNLLAQQPVVAHRNVKLSPRSDVGRLLSARKKHPARRQREAHLSFRGCSVDFPMPAMPKKDLSHLPDVVTVNVVKAFEEHPPEGEPAVRWLLVTSEPIETIEQLIRVVDLYRVRWLIEELFKSLKTGCGFTKRQLDSAPSLLAALAILSPIAWYLLLLRFLQRHAAEHPARLVMSLLHLALLRGQFPKLPWSEVPTVGEATAALAKLGGHLKRNGPPGWLTLGRGHARLLDMEAGWRALQGSRWTCSSRDESRRAQGHRNHGVMVNIAPTRA